jgi:hypothetical protein
MLWASEANMRLDRKALPVTRHNRNLRFSKSLSHLELYYSHLTPVISRLLIINTMLPTY